MSRNQNLVSQVVQQKQTQKYYSGPVPNAEELKKYNEVNPSFAERLLAMAEKEQANRILLNEKVIELNNLNTTNSLRIQEENIKTIKRGQYLATFTVICIIGLCIVGFYFQANSQVAIIATSTIVGTIVAFMKGKQQNKPN